MINKIVINNTLTINKDFDGFAHIFKSIEGLEEPERRSSITVFAGMHGGYIDKQLYGPRMIIIEGTLRCNPDGLLANRLALINAAPINTSVSVQFYVDDGRILTVQAKMKDTPNIKYDNDKFSDFQMIFIADDWRLADTATGEASKITLQPLSYGGLRWFTNSDGKGLRWFTGSGLRWYAGNGAVQAVNSGTVESDVKIVIRGVVQNPTIRNTTTGEYIKINIGPTSASDIIEIDSLYKTIKLNGGLINSLKDPLSDFFTLQPGSNMLEFTITNDNANATAEIYWYSTYVGI